MIKFKHLGLDSPMIRLEDIIGIEAKEMEGSIAHKNCIWIYIKWGGMIRVRFESEKQKHEKIAKLEKLIGGETIEI